MSRQKSIDAHIGCKFFRTCREAPISSAQRVPPLYPSTRLAMMVLLFLSNAIGYLDRTNIRLGALRPCPH